MPGALRIPRLKAWQLKYWAFLTGMPSTGTKADLQSLLTHRLEHELAGAQRTKIVSVDMGIRNLAFCVVEVTPKSKIKVSAWKRLDLLSNGDASTSLSEDIPPPASRPKLSVAKDAFTPASLSKTALRVTEELLSHHPSTILIERQRFRSGGAAAIQEWTVRVNMLESMLWASLETLRSRSGADEDFPETHAISPARVADFWTSPSSKWSVAMVDVLSEDAEMPKVEQTEISGRRKVDKKAKIDVVRSWINGESDVQLEFSGDAADIAEAFKLNQRRQKEIQGLAGGKIDDLADCLLQALAWLKWRENCKILGTMWRQ